MSTLPTLRVTTKHSEYVIDQEAGTVTRTRVHDDASDFGDRNPVAKPYFDIRSELTVGNYLFIEYQDGSWTQSTPITAIKEEWPEAVA